MGHLATLKDYVFANRIDEGRKLLGQYVRDHGVQSPPFMDVEEFLALRNVLMASDLDRFIGYVLGRIVRDPQAGFWHRLLFYRQVGRSAGFLVTLELLDRLEEEITGREPGRSPIRELVAEHLTSAGSQLLKERDRLVLDALAALPAEQDPGRLALYRYAIESARAYIYARAYWLKSAASSLDTLKESLGEVLAQLGDQPLTASYLLVDLLVGYDILGDWDSCGGLVERMAALPGSSSPTLAWQCHLATQQYDLDKALQLLADAREQQCESTAYWGHRAAILFRTEDFTGAREALEEVTTIVRSSGRKWPVSPVPRGYCLYRESRFDEAVAQWRQAKSSLWSGMADRLAEKSETDSIEERILHDIPGIRQKPNHCGPCALAMIGKWWGQELSQEQIASELSEWGTNICQIAESAEKHGFKAVFGHRDFDRLVEVIRAGFPVLIDYSYPGGGHFAVAVGYDPNLDIIDVRDPGFTELTILSRERYQAESGYSDFQTLVICPPDKVDLVPPLDHDEAYYRDLLNIHFASLPAQGTMDLLTKRFPNDEVEQTSVYRELRLRCLLDEGRRDDAAELAEGILAQHDHGLYACSRVSELFLAYHRVQDAFDVLNRLDSDDGDGARAKRPGTLDFLQRDHSTSHDYLQFVKAKCALRLEFLQVAVVSLLRSINMHPVSGHKFLTLAEVMNWLGEDAEQLKYLDVAQQIFGPNVTARYAEFSILCRTERLAEATAHIDETIELFPDHKSFILEKGRLLEQCHDEQGALACYEDVCRELPTWDAGYMNLLRLYDRRGDRAAAEVVLAGLDEAMGTHPDRWCIRGQWHLHDDDWQACLEQADACLAESPGYPWAAFLKARALERLGRLDEALDVLELLIKEVDPSDEYWGYAIASVGRISRKLLDTTRFDAIFEAALDIAPDSDVLWRSMSECFRITGNVAEAQRYFEQLHSRVTNRTGLALMAAEFMCELRQLETARYWYSTIHPGNARHEYAVLGLARTYLGENRVDDALDTLTQFASDHDSSEACTLITDCYLRKYDTAGAMMWFKKELEEFPLSDLTMAIPALNALHRSGQMAAVEDMIRYFRLQRQTAGGQRRAEMSVFASHALDLLDRTDEAIDECRSALDEYPGLGMGWIVLADQLFSRGRCDEAIEAARTSCKTRYSLFPFRRLFTYLRDTGRIEEAFDTCIDGLAAFPSNLELQELLDDLVLGFQMLEPYLDACQRLEPVIEDKAEFIGNQAMVFLKLGEFDRARQYLERALEHGEKSWLYCALGNALRELQQFIEAEQAFLKALDLEPQFTYATSQLTSMYSDWYFAYDEIARRLAAHADLPTAEQLLERIHAFYGQMARFDPNNVELFGDYSQFCSQCGDLSPAKDLLPLYESEGHFLPDIYSIYAMVLEEAGRLDETKTYLDMALNADAPEHTKAWSYLRMGRYCRMVEQDPERAIELYRKAVELDPENANTYLSLAYALGDVGRVDEQQAVLLQALQADDDIDPRPIATRLGLVAPLTAQFDVVRGGLDERLAALSPRMAAEVLMEFASGLSQAHDHEHALAVLDEVETVYDQPLNAMEARMAIHQNQHEREKVEELADRLLAIDGDNIGALYQKTQSRLWDGDLLAAVPCLEALFTAGGGAPHFLPHLAQPAAELDAVAPLYDMCNRCYPMAHVRTDLHILQMLLYHYSGDTPRALDHLDALGRLDMNQQGPGRFYLTDAMIAQGRFGEAIELAEQAVTMAPTDVRGRSLLVGSLLHENQLDAAEPHVKILLKERDVDWQTEQNICRPPEWRYRDTQELQTFLQSTFDRVVTWAQEIGWNKTVRYNLFMLADWWEVDDGELGLVRQLLADGPRGKWIPSMHGYCAQIGDYDLGEQVLSVGEGLHLNPVSMAQLWAIQHAGRGDVDKAIASAYDSRHGHGSRFSEMCKYLHAMRSDLGDLCDTLFDCVVRYHRGHGACSAGALLLLLDNDRMDFFNTGLDSIASFQTDYTLEYLDRMAIQCSVTALRYLVAKKNNDVEEANRLRTVILDTRWFHVSVGPWLYDILDL